MKIVDRFPLVDAAAHLWRYSDAAPDARSGYAPQYVNSQLARDPESRGDCSEVIDRVTVEDKFASFAARGLLVMGTAHVRRDLCQSHRVAK